MRSYAFNCLTALCYCKLYNACKKPQKIVISDYSGFYPIDAYCETR